VGASFFWLISNTLENLENRGKSLGFSFLTTQSGFEISDTLGTWLFSYEVGVSTYLDVYYIGIANTFVVAVIGIFFATILGFSIGIMRLSKNVVIRFFATIYVEFLRNTPLLLQLFFWYFAVLRALPGRREKLEIIGDTVAINIAGLYLPAPIPEEGFGIFFLACLFAIILTFVSSWFFRAKQMETGKIYPVFGINLVVLFGVPALAFLLLNNPLTWSMPEFSNTGPILKRGFQAGTGMVVVPEMIAVLLALSLYTAAFIAEIVRAGILAVHKGQTEAALSLGLRPNITLRLVIIPQALRVIIPPLTSQFLNLTKNSSLAVAIAYPELVSIFAGTALNQAGKEIEMIAMMMAVYLTFSISTSAYMNWFNSRVKLVEK
jgi:general L-amino acid transport system permease protein